MNLRISDLDELSTLSDNDLLVLQSNNTSYKMSFNDFKRELKDKIESSFKVTSTISCEMMQFAPFAHGHNYTDMWFFPSYTSANGNYCGSFNIVKHLPGNGLSNMHELSVWQPKNLGTNDNVVETSSSSNYHVGDIQFIASSNFKTYLTAYRGYTINNSNIDISLSSFDGFVIPNGATFTCQANEFQDACRAYSPSHDPYATSFTVPNLSNMFFKCDPGLPLASTRPLSVTTYHNALSNHTHTIIQNGDALSIEITNLSPVMKKSYKVQKIPSTYYNMSFDNQEMKNRLSNHYENCFFPGYSAKASKQMTNRPLISPQIQPNIQSITLNCSVNGIECQPAGDDAESYPTYINVQALLYIGKKQATSI